MTIRDRIRDFRRVPAKDLRANPKNWRTHPPAQRKALEGILAEVGFADALLAREMPDGSLQLIDGHLRAETTADMSVPVLVVDLNDEEADKLLAALDPLAGLAGIEPGRSYYIWAGYSNVFNYPEAITEAGLYFSQILVWDKARRPSRGGPLHAPGPRRMPSIVRWAASGFREGQASGPRGTPSIRRWAGTRVSASAARIRHK